MNDLKCMFGFHKSYNYHEYFYIKFNKNILLNIPCGQYRNRIEICERCGKELSNNLQYENS